MKLLKYLYCFFVCLCCRHVSAQNTFAFKAKVIHNKKGLMKDMTVLVNSNPAVTNDAGILVIGLPDNTMHVKVALQQADYTILYPTAGYIAIPRDLNDMPEIIIGSPNDNTYLNQYLNLYKAIKNNNAGSAQLNLLNQKLDSLQASLLQMNYTESDLRSAKDMQDGRDEYYKEISENLNDFVSRAIDLKTAFEYLTGYVFDNHEAFQQLYTAVTDYNNVYNILNRQRNNYAKYIINYWQDDSLSTLYNSLIQYALDTVHTGNFFPMTNENVNSINQYLSGNKSTDLKDKIQQHIKQEINSVEPMLIILQQRNAAFQKELTM